MDKTGSLTNDNIIYSNSQSSNTFIEQNTNVSGFETFQSKVASNSLCKRAIGVTAGVAGVAVAGGIFAIKV